MSKKRQAEIEAMQREIEARRALPTLNQMSTLVAMILHKSGLPDDVAQSVHRACGRAFSQDPERAQKAALAIAEYVATTWMGYDALDLDDFMGQVMSEFN